MTEFPKCYVWKKKNLDGAQCLEISCVSGTKSRRIAVGIMTKLKAVRFVFHFLGRNETALRLILDARVPIFKMFHPSPNTARTHAHTSISTLKSLVNFCSRNFLFNKKFDDSTLAK